MLLTAPTFSDPRTSELPGKVETNLGLETPDEWKNPRHTYIFHLGISFLELERACAHS